MWYADLPGFSPAEAAIAPEFSPFPHAEVGRLGEWIPDLSREHGDLSAMMRFVRDHVAEGAGDVRTEIAHASLGMSKASSEEFADGFATSR